MLRIQIPLNFRNPIDMEITPNIFPFFEAIGNQPIQIGTNVYFPHVQAFTPIYTYSEHSFEENQAYLFIEDVSLKTATSTVSAGSRVSIIQIKKETSSFVEFEYLSFFGVPVQLGETVKIKKGSSRFNRDFFQLT